MAVLNAALCQSRPDLNLETSARRAFGRDNLVERHLGLGSHPEDDRLPRFRKLQAVEDIGPGDFNTRREITEARIKGDVPFGSRCADVAAECSCSRYARRDQSCDHRTLWNLDILFRHDGCPLPNPTVEMVKRPHFDCLRLPSRN